LPGSLSVFPETVGDARITPLPSAVPKEAALCLTKRLPSNFSRRRRWNWNGYGSASSYAGTSGIARMEIYSEDLGAAIQRTEFLLRDILVGLVTPVESKTDAAKAEAVKVNRARIQ
jgi:hypothetical protein